MQTIFDYNPTDQELQELFGYDPEAQTLSPGTRFSPLPIGDYVTISADEKLLDVAQLLELRGDKDSAAVIWAQIPNLHQQWQWGHDDVALPMPD